MNIGLDAKRAFHNNRGLGNYSRDVIRLLNTYYGENKIYLFNPYKNKQQLIENIANNIEVLPSSTIEKSFPTLWRTVGIPRYLQKLKIDIYHGLSQELPFGIQRTKVKTVFTFHDAIFMRYPEYYSAAYRRIFTLKNQFSIQYSDHIIAISEQSKRDAIELFNAGEHKISVVYQGCNSIFSAPISEAQKQSVYNKYQLPLSFLLFVGAIEKRKNVKLILEALHTKNLDIPLVIIGRPTHYIKELKETIRRYKMEQQVIFQFNVETADLPAVYSASAAFIFPSIYEGFGIPILEAQTIGTPVITSSGSCFEETGGDAAMYINPFDAEELGEAINLVLMDDNIKNHMISDGKKHAELFSDIRIATNLMNVYNKLAAI